MLSSIEAQRFQLQINLAEIGLSGQAWLQNSAAFCIGVSGLGSPLCLYLAAGGIGRLGFMDGACVEVSNLPRQVLYCSVYCGRSKPQAICNPCTRLIRNGTYRLITSILTIHTMHYRS